MSMDDVVAALGEAKKKLTEAKRIGLQGASILATETGSVTHALGRASAGSPLVASMDAKRKALLEQVMSIDALTQRIDTAIAQARSVARSGDTAGEGGGDDAPS